MKAVKAVQRRVGIATAVFLLIAPETASAVPSFARQLGVGCTVCHTAFPELTPFGRRFKLNGYTMSSEQTHLPPLAVMVQAPAFTHTAKGQPGGAAPDFDVNDNVAVNQLREFAEANKIVVIEHEKDSMFSAHNDSDTNSEEVYVWYSGGAVTKARVNINNP